MRWIGLTPAADTAFALGDTLQLAATMTDAHGERLAGVVPGWRSTDTAVALVDSAGSVVARAPGTATIVVAAGDRIAQARIVVAPRAAGVRIYAQDSLLRVPEGEDRRLVARVVDARGHPLPGERALWRSADPSVAAVDSAAQLHGLAPGRTVVTASAADRSAELAVEVYPVAGSITLLSGDGQRAAAGQRLPLPVRIQVVSRSGRPMAAVPVHFLAADAADAGPHAEPGTDTTDASGVARAEWTLGGLPGRQRLAVGVDGLAGPTFVVADADPVPANARVVALDSAGSGRAGELLATAVGIRLIDSVGAPLPDVPVTWSTDGGGVVEPIEARTDSSGEARARWRLGPRAGLQRAFVQVGGPRALPRATLPATALAGPAFKLRLAVPGPRSGTVGELVRHGPTIVVNDRLGNPVAGVPVRLIVTGGALRDSAPVSDAAGRVTPAWTLGRTPGEQRLSAAVAGVDSALRLSVSVGPGTPDSIAVGGVPQMSGAGQPLAAPLRLQVLDAFGNPVTGASVRLAASAGKLTPSSVATDGRGQATARWTLGARAGRQTLTAILKGGAVRTTVAVQAAATKLRSRRAP